jgi:hypothetical protein
MSNARLTHESAVGEINISVDESTWANGTPTAKRHAVHRGRGLYRGFASRLRVVVV